MPRLLRLFVLSLLAVPSFATAAFSGVPSPFNSTVPACLAATPGGGILTTVTVRDIANNPIVNSTVVIDYSDCPGFVVCPSLPGDGYIHNAATHSILMVTNAVGQAVFNLRAGGGCGNNGIRVYADGILLAQIHAASPDQNGDLTVDPADLALEVAKEGTADLTGDINCDFIVDVLDRTLVQTYMGQTCTDPTPSHRPSWGMLKTIYR